MRIDVQGVRPIIVKMTKIPARASVAGLRASADYIVGVFRRYPPYKYVSVEQAGGWKSERQRKFVMAMIRSGRIKIPYRRTRRLANAWTVRMVNQYRVDIRNATLYARWVQGDEQSTMMALRHWEKGNQAVEKRLPEMRRRFFQAVAKTIRESG